MTRWWDDRLLLFDGWGSLSFRARGRWLHYSAGHVLTHHSEMIWYGGTICVNGMTMLFFEKVVIYDQLFMHALCLFFFCRNYVLCIAVPSRPWNRTMGGKSIRSEPSELVVSEAARKILEKAGWLTYFGRLRKSNEIVAMEFLQNLQEEHSVVGGKQIAVTK